MLSENESERKSGTAALGIDVNRRLLNRYRFVAQETMHLLAGWLPRIERFELKCEAGRLIWECSLHVNAYYLRLREIQSPAFQKPDDDQLIHLFRELPHAPDERALLLAFERVILPDLIRALANHEHATFPNSDLPSVYAIRHALLDLRAQLDRLRPLLSPSEPAGTFPPHTLAWLDYVQALLTVAGGLDGELDRRDQTTPAPPPCRTEFQPPTAAGRDDRFVNRGADLEALPEEDDYEKHTVEEFERYSTEMLAAETVAVVLHRLPTMPWEFQFDAARHLYDEVRHCLMGFEWMRRHGHDPFKSPQYLQIFRWRSQFPPVMQYCLLTMGNEVHSFAYRHRRVEAHQRAKDDLSEQFVRYDIADETQHVRFGHRWLPVLLQHVGEERDVATFTRDALEVWNSQYRTGQLHVAIE